MCITRTGSDTISTMGTPSRSTPGKRAAVQQGQQQYKGQQGHQQGQRKKKNSFSQSKHSKTPPPRTPGGTPNAKAALHRSPSTPIAIPKDKRVQQYHQQRQSATPSPKNFASSKCYDPPTPTSLPKPPTSWVPSNGNGALLFGSPMPVFPSAPKKVVSARQSLNFDDLQEVRREGDDLSQQLKLLLNVQA